MERRAERKKSTPFPSTADTQRRTDTHKTETKIIVQFAQRPYKIQFLVAASCRRRHRPRNCFRIEMNENTNGTYRAPSLDADAKIKFQLVFSRKQWHRCQWQTPMPMMMMIHQFSHLRFFSSPASSLPYFIFFFDKFKPYIEILYMCLCVG